MIDDPIDLQDLWASTRDHYNGLWTLYAVVAFGFGGFAFTDTYRNTPRMAKRVLTLVFLLFAATSVTSSLAAVHLQRETLRLLGVSQGSSQAVLVERMQPPPDWLVLTIHTGAAAAVVFALWFSTWRAKAMSRESRA